MKLSLILLGGLLSAGVLPAADALSSPVLSSPILGYVLDDAANAIRRVSGVPGAASLAEAVNAPVALIAAFVHSGARVAMVTTKDGSLGLLSWGSGAQLTVIAPKLGAVHDISFSRSGGRVALTDGATVEVWSTNGTPGLVGRGDPGEGITKIAVNDNGVLVASTVTGRLVRFTEEASDAQSISTGGDWSALSFSSDGTDVIAADAARKELVRITADGGRVVIGTLPETVNAIAVAADGQQFAAALSSGLLLISAAGTVTPIACDCQPKGLDLLQGGLVVHVRGTAKVLDAEGGEPRLTILPNLLAVNAGGAN